MPGDLNAIEKAAQKLIALSQKEKQTKADKEKMLAIHAEILENIENLAECDLCSAISEIIVTLTLADVTAKLCRECGIKALEAGKIQSSKQRGPRKRTRRAKPATTTVDSNSPTDRAAKKPESAAALHTRVEGETGIKKSDIKRLHKIIQDIAAPMTPEHTFTYVQREAAIAKIKADADALERAVLLLTDKADSHVTSTA